MAYILVYEIILWFNLLSCLQSDNGFKFTPMITQQVVTSLQIPYPISRQLSEKVEMTNWILKKTPIKLALD